MNIKEIFGNNLRKYRRAIAYSQEELAERADVSVKHIGALEAGNSFVSAELLEKFCSILNVKPQYFFLQKGEVAVDDFPFNQVDQAVHGLLHVAASNICREIRRSVLAAEKKRV